MSTDTFTVTYIKAPSEPDIDPVCPSLPLSPGRGPRHLLAARRNFAATRAAILEALDSGGYDLIGYDREQRPVYATRRAQHLYKHNLNQIVRAP